ncbi:MAG: membrane protein insertion efficiency factor YidD [Planctomycetota bacterium]
MEEKEPENIDFAEGRASEKMSLTKLPAYALIACVRFYQKAISPLIGPNCRYQPTCSEYMIQSIRKYGFLFGSWKGICRIARCHPFSKGGFDPP